ncbi:hypothetical protein [Streptomyces sp. NPDC059788]|uniref:hypothetical protein n=1 Tax=Streptomyces sp. NPDC059788 TaxID=3346948 RepID=UPI003657E38A
MGHGHPRHTGGDKSHPDFGAKQQDRVYGNFSDLARALAGWVEAKESRHREKELAHEVKDNSDVELHLETLLLRIRRWIDTRQADAPDGESRKWDDVRQELETGRTPGTGHDGLHDFGHYQKYFDRVLQERRDLPAPVRRRLRTGINGGMAKVLADPTRFTFRDKIIVLHDLMEYFGPRKHWNAPTAGNGTMPDEELAALTTTEIDADGQRTATTTDRGQLRFTGPRGPAALSTPAWPAGSPLCTRRSSSCANRSEPLSRGRRPPLPSPVPPRGRGTTR